MKLTEFAIRNPLVVAAVTVAIGIFGLFAYLSLGVAIIPNINFPAVVVTTVYPGADPETVENNVTRPIEDAISGLPNMDKNGLTSVSSQGVSTVTVQFTSAANADLVGVDVERVVNSARNNLPADAESPIVSKIDINAFGVATVVFSGPQPLPQLQQVAEDVVQKRFNVVPGVGSTNIRSGITREMDVQTNQAALDARGLSINSVIAAIQSQQLEIPAGTITRGGLDRSVYFSALAQDPEALGNIVVAQTPNGAVRLKDVATIRPGIKARDSIVRVNGREGIALVVTKLPDANTIQVVNGVQQAIDELGPQLPPGSSLDIVVNAGTYTQKSFLTVQRALLEAVIGTGLILLLFLHTWRSTLIVLISIPTSLLATLTVMTVLDYNLNLLTMMALTLCVGILVDDSIVVLENIARHLGMGKPPVQAALEGRSEIGLAALTITFVDVVVYLPIAVMVSGIGGQFIRPFALVIASATLTSLIVSFTLTPLLASRFLEAHHAASRSLLARFGRAWDAGFFFVERRYEWLLGHSLPRPLLVIGVGLLAFAAGISLWIMGFIGSDFFPSGDQSEIDITLSMPPSTSLDQTSQAAAQIEAFLHRQPEVRSVYTVAGSVSGGGFGDTTGHNSAQITALLVSPHERSRPSSAIANAWRPQLLSAIPGSKLQIGLPNAFGFGGFGGQPIQVQVQGTDPATVDRLAGQVEQAVRGVPGAVGVRNSNENVQVQERLNIDWAKAADLGVSPQAAGATLRASIDGWTSNANQYRPEGQTAIDIRVLTENAGNLSLDQIMALPVSSSNGGVVRLGQFTTVQEVQIPTAIRHVNRLRSVTVGAEPGPGKLVGDVQNGVQQALHGLRLPPGYQISYAGQASEGADAFVEIFRALGVALLLMYMLMMMLFGSVVLPLAVMMSLPLALVGAFGSMALTHTPFTLFSLLGFAVLLGLVGKNAILLVDYTEILRARGYDRTRALLEAGPTRLRPIVMTTLSVMAALLPIASGVEEGSELLQSAAVVLIGGLITSTLLTLVFVPAMYQLFDSLEGTVRRLFHRGTRPVIATAAAQAASHAPLAAGLPGAAPGAYAGGDGAPNGREDGAPNGQADGRGPAPERAREHLD